LGDISLYVLYRRVKTPGASPYDVGVTDVAVSEARPFQPWRLHGDDRLDGRRRELFALAAPVFRQHGFRGATIKALAHACRLSPSSLYHYFGSKEELATYLVRRPRMDWDSTWIDPQIEPLVQLRMLVDLSLTELPNFLLALRLADEIAGTPSPDRSHLRVFREGEGVFGRMVVAAAPGLSRPQAERAARDVLSAMVGSAIVGLAPDRDGEIRDRVIAVLRTCIVPAHVDARRFDSVMRSTE